MSDYLAILVLMFSFLTIGGFLLHRISHGISSKLRRIALSYGLGIGVFTLALFYLNMVNIKISRTLIVSLVVLILATSVIFVIYRIPTISFSSFSYRIFSPYILIAAFLFILLVIKSLAIPMRCFDERAKWAMKAKIIHHEGTVKTSDFSDQHRLHIDRNYPLLLSYLETSAFFMMGKSDDQKIKILFPVFLIFTVLLLFTALRENSSHFYSSIFALYLSALPYIHHSSLIEGGSADTGYADMPLAFFYFASVENLLQWKKTGRGLLLSSLFISFAMFTKLEGLVMYAGWSFLGLFWLIKNAIYTRSKKNENKYEFFITLIFLLLPALLMTPFFILTSSFPKDGIDYLGNFTFERIFANADRFYVIFAYFLSVLFSWRWSFLGLLSALAVIIFSYNVRRFENLAILWFVFFPLSCYFLMLEITPADVYWQLEVAMNRLILHVAPTLIYFVGRVAITKTGDI